MFKFASLAVSIGLILTGCSSKKAKNESKPKVSADSQYSRPDNGGGNEKRHRNSSAENGVHDQLDEIEDANGDYLRLDRVYFGFDRHDIVKQGSEVLEKYSSALKATGTDGQKIKIDGHADERGTAEYNIALGHRRANAVHQKLKQLGVKVPMETRSYGKFKPAAEGHDEDAWEKNRRAEFHLISKQETDENN